MSSSNAEAEAGEISASFKSRKPKLNNNNSSSNVAPPWPISRAASQVDDLITLLHGSDPLRLELNRLHNDLRDKERELGEALAEIKSLKISERLKEKAVEELTDELNRLDEKLKADEALLESKNLEIKKINDEKRAALAAQFAAEATLRRVHAAQKDDEMPPIEAIITPLEAELKLARLEAAKLQEDNRVLDRLTKSKEAALLEAERTVDAALAKASLVDDLQNKNQDLMKQIEICQEENKTLDKMHRQKVAEVEKLMQTIRELEEAVLVGGAAANAVRDYQRKVQEMNEEKKILERELARAKVSANRVATVIANEWKDGNDKVMPVKQWLEERRVFQGEMQQLRDKLAVVERTAKAEAQLKEKYQLRFKVLEERFRVSKSNSRVTLEGRNVNIGHLRRQSLGGVESFSRSTSNSHLPRKASNVALLRNSKTSTSDGGRSPLISDPTVNDCATSAGSNHSQNLETIADHKGTANGTHGEEPKSEEVDYVSGILYDMLQKEVVTLRKACHEKDQSLKDKDNAIEMLAKKVDSLNKAMEVEAKKMRREVAAMEKEIAAMQLTKNDRRVWQTSVPSASHLVSARNARNR